MGYLHTFSFWEWLDIFGLLIVTLGCCGELLPHIQKPIFNPTNFGPLEPTKHKWEIGSLLLVVFGLACEFVALPMSLKQSHEEVQHLEQTNLVLRAEVAVLEKQVIDAQQEHLPIAILQAALKLEILFPVDSRTAEVRAPTEPDPGNKFAGKLWISTTNGVLELVANMPLNLRRENASPLAELFMTFHGAPPNLFGSSPDKQAGLIDAMRSVSVRLFWQVPGGVKEIDLRSGTLTIVANTKMRKLAVSPQRIDARDAVMRFAVTNDLLIAPIE